MRFYLIDALRGVAALWVLLFHADEGGHLVKLSESFPRFAYHVIFEIGHAGVPIFFVISGFVIAHSLRRHRVTGKYFAGFALRRSIRLDPPYWGSIVLFIGLAWVSSAVKGDVFEWPGFGAILAHLFYLQSILEIPHINIIYWTLCLEIQFYLVFCGLMYAVQKVPNMEPKLFPIIFVAAAIISLLWPIGVQKGNIYPGLFFPHWHAFLLGVFAYWSWQKRIPATAFYTYSAVVLGSAIVREMDFSLVAVITAVFVHECARAGRIEAWNWPWLQFLGLISYSLYLTHVPITGASFFILYKLLGDSLWVELVALVITTGACICFAYLFWWILERWSMRLSKGISIANRPIEKG